MIRFKFDTLRRILMHYPLPCQIFVSVNNYISILAAQAVNAVNRLGRWSGFVGIEASSSVA